MRVHFIAEQRKYQIGSCQEALLPTFLIDFLREELMIIDTHIHIGGKAGTFDMKESDVLYAIQTYHIDKAIVSNADSLEFDANHVILP